MASSMAARAKSFDSKHRCTALLASGPSVVANRAKWSARGKTSATGVLDSFLPSPSYTTANSVAVTVARRPTGAAVWSSRAAASSYSRSTRGSAASGGMRRCSNTAERCGATSAGEKVQRMGSGTRIG